MLCSRFKEEWSDERETVLAGSCLKSIAMESSARSGRRVSIQSSVATMNQHIKLQFKHVQPRQERDRTYLSIV